MPIAVRGTVFSKYGSHAPVANAELTLLRYGLIGNGAFRIT